MFFFSGLLRIPSSFIALLVLSIGTNVPELVIASRSIMKKEKDVAFGDYMGSAAMNSLLFGLLGIANMNFIIERTEFVPTFLLFSLGLVLFIIFCNSKRIISRGEGLVLMAVYGVYLVWQFNNLVRFLGD